MAGDPTEAMHIRIQASAARIARQKEIVAALVEKNRDAGLAIELLATFEAAHAVLCEGPARGEARASTPSETSQTSSEPGLREDGETPNERASTEIALLDGRGIIVETNDAWRAAFASLSLPFPNAGLGAPYAEVARLALSALGGPLSDKDALDERLDDVLSGRKSHFDATYAHGEDLRRVRVAPLRVGGAAYFVAVHEDLIERARILAALHEMSDQVLHAQERERQRIAIELHDSMSQHLAGLALSLSALRKRVGNDRGSGALIDEMAKLTQQVVRETRVLSYLMNAARREREGLETSVRKFVEGFGLRAELSTNVEVEGPVDAVSAAVKHAVFRIVQEALSNVYRHADATKVSVKLSNQADKISLRIADNGRGIRQSGESGSSEAPLGVGISGMRARIEQLAGSFALGGGARGGTVVTATIPTKQGDNPKNYRKRLH